ncbi:hypothetical protein HNQ50_000305 [Silvimonas terrae]|uniref:Uncharacterized protein n=1 Tax=Silvimonas terrae TaxID=300266 RepID=A0A840R8F1_9NEIS|nr:hypothetical protein [Silvimonas terrae]MBB5189595.1 hypothetical protein [Silvimonas terrae]
MEPIRITYRMRDKEETFIYDFGAAVSPAEVDSLVLEAVIQHEFPEDLALRRIVDFPLGEQPIRDTIETVMHRFALHHIEYQIGEKPQNIRSKHLFHL